MKKRVIAVALAATLAGQAGAVNLIVDNVQLNPDVPPVIVEGRTLVPVRAIFEALGAEVNWDGTSGTATATKGATTVAVQVGSATAYVNGVATQLDVPAQTIDNRTLVPARFVSEALGADVQWNSTTETVSISTSVPTSTPQPPKSTPTLGQQNALDTAHAYLDFMAFSHSRLIKQLEYEGYSAEEAKYAADNCGADWNEQAAKKAQDYLDLKSFSRSGLIKQLEYEGFTSAQAEYGAQAVGY